MLKCIIYIDKLKFNYKITINGCLTFAKIVFSLIIWSTCFNLIISAFFNYFRATYLLVYLFFASFTLPN